ncbi:MAG: type III secretion system outer membrane ring subunit SctC [Steroidobacteraceae bacterium]
MTYPSYRLDRYVVRALLLAVLALAAVQARAAPIPFSVEKVSYDLQGETLKGFLLRFFDDLGIAVTLSPAVQEESGTLNGPRSGMAAAVFKSIADSNGLVAYYDGSVAFIYKTRELSSRYFEIDPARVDAFREATIGFGLPDANNSLQIKASTGVVTARGTPRFLDQLAQLSTALVRRPRSAAAAPTPRTTLRFFSLKYAWAADTTFTVGNQRTVVPGVATILNQLLGDGDNGASVGGSTYVPPAVSGLRGKGLAALGNRLATTQGTGGYSAGLESDQSAQLTAPARSAFRASIEAGDTPRIVADPYRNALIIRDTPERMPAYEELVHKLDVESQIIQLDATVIDIDKSRVRQLGIDWTYQHGNTAAAFGGGVHPMDTLGNLAGLQVNSIITDASNFTARLNALEQEGVTNIVQRPQVVTLNDAEAVIESTQSVYVPVSGAFDEDLFGVIAGTVLRVTPHIIVDNGRQRIRLLVTIEDGNVQVTDQPTTGSNGQTLVRPVPSVVRNAVNTQAIIDVGQGLLLGGLNRRENTRTTSRIPFLGSIPLLGRLFRSDITRRDNTERLFLISPQIIAATAVTLSEPLSAPLKPRG